MSNVVTVPLPHDLPENWTDNQFVSPGGVEVGLTPQHGYNYLMQQVNRAQMAIEELDSAVGGAPAKNLLDNWYFVGGGDVGKFPVNQLGNKDYPGISGSIDRWPKVYGGRVTIAADCITLTGTGSRSSLVQTLDAVHLPCTLSVLTRDGFLHTKTITSYEDATLNVADFSFGVSSNTCVIGIPAETVSLSIVAIKLELGTTQTLARQENNAWVLTELPNYAEQMAKCFQYSNQTGAYVGFPQRVVGGLPELV